LALGKKTGGRNIFCRSEFLQVSTRASTAVMNTPAGKNEIIENNELEESQLVKLTHVQI